MQYPFEFSECLLTSDVLDRLGFSEYWGGSGDFGERDLYVAEGDAMANFKVIELDSLDDGEYGYGYDAPRYNPTRFVSSNFHGTFYFLHELYEEIKAINNETILKFFLAKCKDQNFMPYIDSYEEYLKGQLPSF